MEVVHFTYTFMEDVYFCVSSLLHLSLGFTSASGNNKDILLVVGLNYNFKSIYHI